MQQVKLAYWGYAKEFSSSVLEQASMRALYQVQVGSRAILTTTSSASAQQRACKASQSSVIGVSSPFCSFIRHNSINRVFCWNLKRGLREHQRKAPHDCFSSSPLLSSCMALGKSFNWHLNFSWETGGPGARPTRLGCAAQAEPTPASSVNWLARAEGFGLLVRFSLLNVCYRPFRMRHYWSIYVFLWHKRMTSTAETINAPKVGQ